MKENYTYKNLEEASNTPHLRFPEFTGEWTEKKLGDCLDYEQPQEYLVESDNYVSNGIPVLTAGKTFILGYTKEKEGVFNNLPVIIFDDFTTASKFVDFPFKAKSSAMKMLLPKKDVNLRFVYESMQLVKYQADDHKRHWISFYSNIPILLPPTLAEQQKIADCLSSLDDMIRAEGQKTEALREYKRGLMQQLFPANGATTPQLRFPGFTGEWKEKKLGEIIVESKDVSTTENEDILLTSSIDGMFLNSEVFSHQRGRSTIGYRKIKKGMLVLSAQNLHLGNANVNLRFESGLVSPAYKVYDIVGCSSMFMGQWVKRESTKQLFLQATTQGASECRKNVVWEQLYQQKLLLPSSAEQQKIADCLSSLDDMISAQAQKTETLREYKRGLMQQLFPQPSK